MAVRMLDLEFNYFVKWFRNERNQRKAKSDLERRKQEGERKEKSDLGFSFCVKWFRNQRNKAKSRNA